MVDYHVKNTGHLTKAFKVRGGHTTVAAGKTADVVDARELTEAQIDALAKDGVKVTSKGGKSKDGDKPSGLTVTDKGRGWFAITQDGKEVTKSLREDDVKGFADMSADDQAAFVDLHKPE